MLIYRISLHVRNKSIATIESRCVIAKVLLGTLRCNVTAIIIGNYANLSPEENFDCWFPYCLVTLKINIYILGPKGQHRMSTLSQEMQKQEWFETTHNC